MNTKVCVWLFSALTLVEALAYSQQYGQQQQTYTPYYYGPQATFVQPPYNSSVYTEYNYDPNRRLSNRLPPYTTNQTVFVQQPYGTALQTVNPYPSRRQYGLPYTTSGYNTPVDYPSTTSQAYPFGTVRSYTSSPYPTTTQYPSYTYPYTTETYTTTETYPYTATRQSISTPTIQPSPGTQVYSARNPAYETPNALRVTPNITIQPSQPPTSYPSTTPLPGSSNPYATYQTAYPMTTAIPEGIQPPVVAAPLPPPPPPTTSYYYSNPNQR